MLATVAESVAGIDKQTALDFLDSKQGLAEIRAAQRLLSELGIHRYENLAARNRFVA